MSTLTISINIYSQTQTSNRWCGVVCNHSNHNKPLDLDMKIWSYFLFVGYFVGWKVSINVNDLKKCLHSWSYRPWPTWVRSAALPKVFQVPTNNLRASTVVSWHVQWEDSRCRTLRSFWPWVWRSSDLFFTNEEFWGWCWKRGFPKDLPPSPSFLCVTGFVANRCVESW